MKQVKRNGFRLSLLILALVLVLFGCSKGGTNETPKSSGNGAAAGNSPAATGTGAELPPVNLTWYYGIGTAQPDQQAVENAVNQYLKEKTKLNITLKLKPIDFGSYDQKMNVVIAANEDMDLIWTTGSWLLKYNENVKKGAFLALDDLLPKYAPKTFNDMMPARFWNDVKADLDGKIYAVPNYQIAATSWGLVFQKRFVDKYHFDVSSVKTLQDLEPFLETLKKNEPDIIPFAAQTPGGVNSDPNLRDYRGMTYNIRDPYTLIFKQGTPQYKAQLELLHSWYEKKYIYQDVATVKDWTQFMQKGNVAVFTDSTFKPGNEVEMKTVDGGYDVVMQPLTKPFFTGITSTMTAVSKTSKNPKQALMLLELVNNDPAFYRLLSYGIEGKHYSAQDNYYAAVPNSAYAPGIDWVFGNQFNGLVRKGQPSDVFERTKKLNESAEVSPLTGFTFDDSALSTEVAAVNAVNSEYKIPLESGTSNPAIGLPKYLDALKKAGQDKIDAERAKQLAAWVAKNGKKQ